MGAGIDVAFDLPGPWALAQLRAWIRRDVARVFANVAVELELVTTELASNALEHAAGPRSLRLFQIPGRDVVRVEVDDASPDRLPTPGASRLGQHRGRGLTLIDAMARWGVRRHEHGKTLWAELPIH